MQDEYILCALYEKHHTGDIFTSWPLHTTLVTWAYLDDPVTFVKELKRLLKASEKISSTVGKQREWGEHTVNVLARVPELYALHTRLLKLVRSRGNILVNEHYMGEHYTPHITHQGMLSAAEASRVVIADVYLIKKPPGVQEKTIVAKFPLGEEE